MKSRMTDGETRARPAVAVCCVAIFAASPPRALRVSRPSEPPILSSLISPPCPLLANEKGARDGEERPLRHRAKDARAAQKRRLGSLDVAGLLHCGFGAGLGFRE